MEQVAIYYFIKAGVLIGVAAIPLYFIIKPIKGAFSTWSQELKK